MSINHCESAIGIDLGLQTNFRGKIKSQIWNPLIMSRLHMKNLEEEPIWGEKSMVSS